VAELVSAGNTVPRMRGASQDGGRGGLISLIQVKNSPSNLEEGKRKKSLDYHIETRPYE